MMNRTFSASKWWFFNTLQVEPLAEVCHPSRGRSPGRLRLVMIFSLVAGVFPCTVTVCELENHHLNKVHHRNTWAIVNC